MPNRIIKESIHESEDVAMMTDFEFRLWVNLIAYVDDYGRGDARPAIIKGKCFPLRDSVHVRDIVEAMKGLEKIGCIKVYEADEKKYFYFPKWDAHQRIRQKHSKCPNPNAESVKCGNSPQLAADCGNLRPESESESSSESESEIESESEVESESSSESESNPSMEEVEAFALSRNSKVSAKDFFDYYDPGWRDGEGKPIKYWKKLFISWERRVSNGRSGDPPESEDRFGSLRYDNE